MIPVRLLIQLLPKRLDVQIVALVSLLLFVSILLLTLFTNYQTTQQVTASIKEQAKVLAQNVAASGSSYLFSTYYEPLETLLIQSAQFPGVHSIAVFDNEGKLIREAKHKIEQDVANITSEQYTVTLPAVNQLMVEEKDAYIVTWMPIIRSFVQGWVRVEYSVDSLFEIQIKNSKTNLVFGCITMALTVTIILFFLKYPLQYIRQVARYSEQLDSNVRSELPVYQYAQELKALGESINLATLRLNKNEQEVRNSIQALEAQKFAMDQHSIVSITDTQGIISYANEKFCEISGHSEKELLGNTHRLIKSGLHSQEFYSRMWKTLTDGKVWHGEICNRSKSGELYWVDTTIVPFLDTQGHPYQFVAIRTEITEHKLALNELNDSKQRIQQSQTFANIGSWELDINTQEVRISDNTAGLFGRSELYSLGNYSDMLALIHEDDRPHVTRAIEDCIKLGKKYSVEYRAIWPNGSIYWLQDSGNVLRDENGKAKKLFSVIRDVTEQKLSAEKIESLARFPDENPNPVLRVSLDERITYCNPSGMWLLECWQTDLDKNAPAELSALLKKARSQQDNISSDMKIGLRYFGVTISYAPGVDYFNVYMRDITERYLAEEKLQEYQKHLEDLIEERTRDLIEARDAALMAERSMSTFLANMSHELRTPLHAILSFAHFGIRKMDKVSKEKLIHYFTEIHESGNSLLALVNNLLDLSKLRAGKMSYHFTKQDLTKIINNVKSELSLLAENKNIKVFFDSQTPMLVVCDVDRIAQVVRNLLSNAIKFSENNKKIIINLKLNSVDEAEFNIEDEGPGIPENELDLIFVPFEQSSKTVTNAGGTGLGLPICKEIIEGGHQGKIVAANLPDGGSVFTFKIPSYILASESLETKIS